MNKYLIFGISSLRPKKLSTKLLENRENDYFTCIESLQKLQINSDLYIFDNTITGLSEIKSKKLQNLLIEKVPDYPVWIPIFFGFECAYNANNDFGYLELLKCTDALANKYSSHNKLITVLNLRRFFISLLWFELINKYLINSDYDILVVKRATDDFEFDEMSDNQISDFIFSMKAPVYIEYIRYIQNRNFETNIRSQDYLWDFIQGKRFFCTDSAGIIRNE
jgi:hypothetical protein